MNVTSLLKLKYGRKVLIACFIFMVLFASLALYLGRGFKTSLIEVDGVKKDSANSSVNGDKIENLNGDLLKDNSTKNVYNNPIDSTKK